MGGAASSFKSDNDITPLDHTSMATLKAVTDATQILISKKLTYWSDVEILLEKYSKIDTLCRSNFNGSIVLSAVVEIVNKELNNLNYNIDNTLFAASLCPDEINHIDNSMVSILSKQWGHCFQMGGLAGIPFPGQTGFGAFASHVPSNGNLFILFAPHVGISEEGEFGKYNRVGQDDRTCTACGAAISAYHHILDGGEIPDFTHLGKYPFDYQQQWIISKIASVIDNIKDASTYRDPMISLPHEMYLIIKDFIDHIISEDHKGKYENIILLGGIHINTPVPMEDFFLPLLFEVRSTTKPTINLMHKFPQGIQPISNDSGNVNQSDKVPEQCSMPYISTKTNSVQTFIRAMSFANMDRELIKHNE